MLHEQDNIANQRLSHKRMNHSDCALLFHIADIKHLSLLIFNPESGTFDIAPMNTTERIARIADVLVETPELVVTMLRPSNNWGAVAWEIGQYRSRLGSEFAYSLAKYRLKPQAPLKPRSKGKTQ